MARTKFYLGWMKTPWPFASCCWVCGLAVWRGWDEGVQQEDVNSPDPASIATTCHTARLRWGFVLGAWRSAVPPHCHLLGPCLLITAADNHLVVTLLFLTFVEALAPFLAPLQPLSLTGLLAWKTWRCCCCCCCCCPCRVLKLHLLLRLSHPQPREEEEVPFAHWTFPWGRGNNWGVRNGLLNGGGTQSLSCRW